MIRWAQEDQIQDAELVRMMFNLLRRQYDSIGELLQALREFYRTDTVTEEMLQEAASLETRYDLRSCSEGSEDWASVFTPAARFECL